MKVIVDDLKKMPTFPKLMIHPTTGTIILATSKGCGTRVNNIDGPKGHSLGDCRTDWRDFVDFNGKVTLSND